MLSAQLLTQFCNGSAEQMASTLAARAVLVSRAQKVAFDLSSLIQAAPGSLHELGLHTALGAGAGGLAGLISHEFRDPREEDQGSLNAALKGSLIGGGLAGGASGLVRHGGEWLKKLQYQTDADARAARQEVLDARLGGGNSKVLRGVGKNIVEAVDPVAQSSFVEKYLPSVGAAANLAAAGDLTAPVPLLAAPLQNRLGGLAGGVAGAAHGAWKGWKNNDLNALRAKGHAIVNARAPVNAATVAADPSKVVALPGEHWGAKGNPSLERWKQLHTDSLKSTRFTHGGKLRIGARTWGSSILAAIAARALQEGGSK
jgi:hypothetical protein